MNKAVRMCYLGHILRRLKPHLLEAALRYQARKLKVGGPIYTWNDSLSQDMDYARDRLEWLEMAKDKEEFNNAARKSTK